mmetsp:Transcript_12607/g.23648  ORF Transcript_12607/g.23648 Transcript_12607/m.23648 type:complete len:127 (-) Transcript_12607:51-431(-)
MVKATEMVMVEMSTVMVLPVVNQARTEMGMAVTTSVMVGSKNEEITKRLVCVFPHPLPEKTLHQGMVHAFLLQTKMWAVWLLEFFLYLLELFVDQSRSEFRDNRSSYIYDEYSCHHELSSLLTYVV